MLHEKYLGISLTKKVKDFYKESYSTLKKETEEDIRKWKTVPCSWVGETNIVKMTILPKLLYRFIADPIKIPTVYFIDLEKTIFKFIWKQKRPSVAKVILGNKSKSGHIADFKLSYKALVIKTVWHRNKTRNVHY